MSEEIRIWTDEGTFRVLYVARLAEAVYVLHAFQKKTQAIARGDYNAITLPDRKSFGSSASD